MNTPPPPPEDPAVTQYVAQRGITEVLHFTTNRGALGVLASHALLSTARLPEEKYIQHILTLNCKDRLKDIDWIDYVSLSISRVNDWMFGRSEKWHEDDGVWWVVLSFDTSLLAHPDVHFVTTNNTYTDVLQRGTGVAGLSALFAPSVKWGWYGCSKRRYSGMPDAWTTDPQAEVLYPQKVPIEYLRAIYVRQPDHADTVRSWFRIFPDVPQVPVIYQPEVFR